MPIKFGDKNYSTDEELQVANLGFWPRVDIKDTKLKEYFEREFGRSFLGGDELVAYAQSLVSRGMDLDGLEQEILQDLNNPEKGNLGDVVFNKTATGIGRGHSLGGLAGVVLGLHGTKMIDSGLTGLCASRSLATSSRRRETKDSEIVIPASLGNKPDLLKEYMQISEEVLAQAEDFKARFGKLGGVETFNKVIPYNNPADLFYVVPLDSMVSLFGEVRADRANPNGPFLPKEVGQLTDKFKEIAEKAGQGIMFGQRVQVPRDTYLHYSVFKDPSSPNYALEMGEENGMNIDPKIVGCNVNSTMGFKTGLEKVKRLIQETRNVQDPKELHKRALENMSALREFVNEYNEAVNVTIADSLSWRVWSEQKRHATLRQNVESVYSAADRAYKGLMPLWNKISEASQTNNVDAIVKMLPEVEKHIVIDERLKKSPELLVPYIYSSARQLMFYGKMLDEGFEQRDALYITPKNIRVRTLEKYDLANLVDLEFPLRLCSTCEPERKASSWKKREAMLGVVPELEPLLQPKCNLGYCTEGKFCGRITDIREYNQDLHKATKDAMLSKGA